MKETTKVVQTEECTHMNLQPLLFSDDKQSQHNKPKLLVLCNGIYPLQTGGAEMHAYYVSNRLAESGNYVHVISVASKKPVLHSFKNKFSQSLIQLWPRRPFDTLSYILKVFLLAYLKRREFGIIQVHIASTAMIPAFMISKITGKPYVVTCHGSEIRLLRKKIVMKLLQKTFLPKASCVVAVSKEIRDLLITEYGLSSESIKIIPNGYDEVFVKQIGAGSSSRICPKPRSLVFVGSLREVKDPLNLIEAFRIVGDRLKNIHLHIIGDGQLRLAVERKIKCYKLQNRVKLHGLVPHQRALEIMASAQVYISTSIEEGFPTSLIEAMALEKAVVATDVGGVPEIILDGVNGLLTPPRLPERMARLIERLVTDSALAEKLGKAAAESVKDFSWNNIAQKYQDIYQGVRRQGNKGG